MKKINQCRYPAPTGCHTPELRLLPTNARGALCGRHATDSLSENEGDASGENAGTEILGARSTSDACERCEVMGDGLFSVRSFTILTALARNSYHAAQTFAFSQLKGRPAS
jgi:hypothetical protein